MSLLTSLPVELRYEIYSYLLLTQNVLRYGLTGEVTTGYATSLFQVNKVLSAETLHYFYSQNAFSIIELHLLERSFEGYLRRFLPIKTIKTGKARPRWLKDDKFPLRAMFRYKNMGYYGLPMALVVPSIELDRLILLLNLQHKNSISNKLAVTANLEFRLASPLFKHKASTADRLLDCLLLLRRPSIEVNRSRFNLVLQGSFNQKISTSLRTDAIELYSQQDRSSRCQDALESAKTLCASGLHKKANNEAEFVCMLARDLHYYPSVDHPFATVLEDAAVDAKLTKSECYLEMGKPLKAAGSVEEATHITYQYARSYSMLHGYWASNYFDGRKLFPVNPYKEPLAAVSKALEVYKTTADDQAWELDHYKRRVRGLEVKFNNKMEKFKSQYPQCLPDPRKASFQL